MKIALLTMFFCICLAACQNNTSSQKDDAASVKDSVQAIHPDTVKSPDPPKTLGELKYLNKNMRLPSVDSGAKGLVIRLYMTTLLKPDLLVTINVSDSVVTGKMFDYYISADSSFHSKLSDRSPKHPLPKSLGDELNKIDFRNIESQPGVRSIADKNAEGILYSMEIATKEYHKVIRFHCPERLVEKDHNCKAFVDAITIMDKYLHFRMPYCQ